MIPLNTLRRALVAGLIAVASFGAAAFPTKPVTLKSPAVVELVDKRALIPLSLCGDQLSHHIAQETARMRKVVERAGIEKQ